MLDTFPAPVGALFDRRLNDADLRLILFISWSFATRRRLIADLEMAEALGWPVKRFRSGLIKLHANGAIEHLDCLRPDAVALPESQRIQRPPKPRGA